jgi:hypothetical protein
VFVELRIPLPNAKCHRWHEGSCNEAQPGRTPTMWDQGECTKEESCLYTHLECPSVGMDFAKTRDSFWCRRLQEADDKNEIGIYSHA